MNINTEHGPAPEGSPDPKKKTNVKTEVWKKVPNLKVERDLLKRGVIADRLREEMRLLPDGHKLLPEFKKAIRDLLEPYANEEELKRFDDTDLLISTRQNIYGFALTHGEQPWLGLGMASLDPRTPRSPQTVEALLGIIIHEFAHIVFEERYPHKSNSKGEEAAADIVAVQFLYDHGLDPKGYLDLMKKIYTVDGVKRKSSHREILDVHPITPNRISYIEAEITRLEQQYGEINREVTLLTEDNPLLGLVEKIEPYSPLQVKMAQTTLTELSAFVHATMDQNPTLAQINPSWCEDIIRSARSISVTGVMQDEKFTVVLNQLADELLNLTDFFLEKTDSKHYENDFTRQERLKQYSRYAQSIVEIYNEVCELFCQDERSPLLGRFQAIGEATSTVIHDQNIDKRLAALRSITKHTLEDDLLLHPEWTRFAQEIEWPTFPLPEKVGDTVAWQELFEAAVKEKEETGNDEALAGLILMGTEDARALSHLSNSWVIRFGERLQWIATERVHNYPQLVGFSKGAAETRDYTFERGGKEIEASKQGIDIRAYRYNDRGVVTTTPDTWKMLWDHLSENSVAMGRALYRKNMLSDLYGKLREIPHSFQTAERIVGDLEEQYGPRISTVQGIEYLLEDTKRFMKINASILEDESQQQAICDALDSAIGENPSQEQIAKARKATDVIFQSGSILGSSFGRSLLGLRDFSILHEGEEPEEHVDETPPTAPEPFISYQFLETHGLYSRREKLELFHAHTEHIRQKSELNTYRPLFAHLFPEIPSTVTNWDEFITAIDLLDQELDKSLSTEEKRYDTLDSGHYKTLADLAEIIIDVEAAGKPTVAQMVGVIKKTQSLPLSGKGQLLSTRQAFAQVVDSPFEYSTDLVKAIEQWSELTGCFNLLSEEDGQTQSVALFEREDWQTLSPKKSISCSKALLATGWRAASSHAFKKRVIDRLCINIAKVIGKDDESEEYKELLQKEIEEIKKLTSGVTREYALRTLAKELSLQRETTALCEKTLKDMNYVFSLESDLGLTSLDFGISMAMDDKDFRDEITHFFCTPLSDESVENMLEKTEDELFMATAYERDTDKRDIEQDEADKRNKLRLMHQNFWNLPQEFRAVMARQLLIPGGEDSKESFEEAYTKLFTYISSPEDADNSLAFTFIRTYADILPDYARPIFLGALLTAAEPTKDEGSRIGKAIAMIANSNSLGPIEKKVVQGAHSHPGTREDIRVELTETKTRVAEPPLWDVDKLIQDIVPEQVQAKIAHYGEVLGAASFFISRKVTLTTGETVVLRLLRPNVVEQAELGLKRLRETTENLIKTNPEFEILFELCDEAERSFRSEVNVAEWKLKAEAAGRMYDGSSEKVDGIEVPIDTCHIIELDDYGPGIGDGWSFISYIEGDLFLHKAIDPTEEKEEELRVKGLALCMRELGQAVSGTDAMDDDWHGGNTILRRDGQTVSRVDHGAITLGKPTSEELKELGRIMAESTKRIVGEQNDPSLSFLEILREKRAQGIEISPLIRRFQKSLLTYAEYRRHFRPGDEEILFAALIERAHQDVRAGFLGNL